MRLTIRGAVFFWRGPAPWFFVTVPNAESEVLHDLAGEVSYGWGMIPAQVTIGRTTYSTALWPKDDCYVVPIKAAVRKAECINDGDEIELDLEVDERGREPP